MSMFQVIKVVNRHISGVGLFETYKSAHEAMLDSLKLEVLIFYSEKDWQPLQEHFEQNGLEGDKHKSFAVFTKKNRDNNYTFGAGITSAWLDYGSGYGCDWRIMELKLK